QRFAKVKEPTMKIIDSFYKLNAKKRRVEPYKEALQKAVSIMIKPCGKQTKLLKGMKHSTSIVKASYLGPIVWEVVSEYLKYKPTPRDMSFSKVYEGLTGSVEMDFFAKAF